MRSEAQGDLYTLRFDSVNDLADHAAASRGLMDRAIRQGAAFTGVSSQREALELARNGWDAEIDTALSVAENAVSKVERECDISTFTPVFDVLGCEVDVARYLDGTPENMIDYPLVPTVRAGRIITLCASIGRSSIVSVDTIMRRGHTVVALALALSTLGYGIEVWTDATVDFDGTHRVQIRTLVKAAGDPVDAARLMYALAHPSMHRVLTFVTRWGSCPQPWAQLVTAYSGGFPTNPIADLPDGAIYLPSVRSDRDVPNADEQLVRYLQELDIVPQD